VTRVIRFYRVGDEHGSFSNFAPYPIEVDGKTRPTSEHYFQTQEFAGTEHEEAVRPAGSPWKRHEWVGTADDRCGRTGGRSRTT
jgi:predicted NAD-dependent protein-ADP-ribosyltransferase YbiA (DUF1768 family)